MRKLQGLHFYINIANLDDVIEKEEKMSGSLNHTIHAMDTFFSSIESYGAQCFENVYVEKITGSRLHMYICGDASFCYPAFEKITAYTNVLVGYIATLPKYKTLDCFQIQIGACHGLFYDFQFTHAQDSEETSIGFAANYAAKLQSFVSPEHVAISEKLYDSLTNDQQRRYIKKQSSRISKYGENSYYESPMRSFECSLDLSERLRSVAIYANKVNLTDMVFRSAIQPVDPKAVSKGTSKIVDGIPFFADVRGFTKQFDNDDANLTEMAQKTQDILTSMYMTIQKGHGIHIQFQGDREAALFHDYPSYTCYEDAIISGMRLIDEIAPYKVSIGIGQEFGRVFVTRIGARGEKDTILLGRTVLRADSLEDDYADENQIVIGEYEYNKLLQQHSPLVEVFTKSDKGVFFTNLSYKDYQKHIQAKELKRNNQQRNYNGAWSE